MRCRRCESSGGALGTRIVASPFLQLSGWGMHLWIGEGLGYETRESPTVLVQREQMAHRFFPTRVHAALERFAA